MQRGERFQSYQEVHNAGRVAVVGAKVKSAEHWVLHLLIAETNVLLYVGVLDAYWLGEVSKDDRIRKVKL